jgi:hypothetical protein
VQHHSATSRLTTQLSQTEAAAAASTIAASSPNALPVRGDRRISSATSHNRLATIDVVSAKLRIIHSRCSTNRRCRAAR